jgi:hypothetical protein
MLVILTAFLQHMNVDIQAPQYCLSSWKCQPHFVPDVTCHIHAYYFDYTVPDLCLILWLSSCPSNAYHQRITAVTFIYCTSMHRLSLQRSYGHRLSMLLVGNLLNYAA